MIHKIPHLIQVTVSQIETLYSSNDPTASLTSFVSDTPERGHRRRIKNKCGPNETYNEQTYLPQENTCEMYLSGQQPSYIGEQCTPGCRCATGYLRNKSGACVMPQNC